MIVNNVIGSGIGLQGQVMSSRGNLYAAANDGIESAFRQWSEAEFCHTGGSLHFADLEIQGMGQVFEAGEVFFRQHFRRFGRSRVPYALELIEAERVPHEYQPDISPRGGAMVRLGVEVDAYQRPIAYWIRNGHPGDIRPAYASTAMLERVPADEIIHLRIINRWPSTRSMPWMHAIIQRLRDMGGYTEAEVIAARAAACYMGFIESAEPPVGDHEEDGQRQIEIQPGLVEHLSPGEKFNPWSPNRPNTGIEAFMRFMLREIAAGVDLSYESLSRDYSQSNYSSSRLALLDDRDLWRMLQTWFLRNFRARVHRMWLQQAVLAGAVSGVSVTEYASNPEKFEHARFKTRGWSWVDPAKEVAAYKEAVRSGFTTVTDTIAATAGGLDIEDIVQTRKRELDMLKDAGITTDTDPGAVAKSQPAAASPGKPDDEDKEPDENAEQNENDDEADRGTRVVSLNRR